MDEHSETFELQKALREALATKTLLETQVKELEQENTDLRGIIHHSGGALEFRVQELERIVRQLEAERETRARRWPEAMDIGAAVTSTQAAQIAKNCPSFLGTNPRSCMRCGFPLIMHIEKKGD